jgi:hypothetical protein
MRCTLPAFSRSISDASADGLASMGRANPAGLSVGYEGARWTKWVACDDMGQVVALEDRGDQLASAVHARSVEHRFQVILHGV